MMPRWMVNLVCGGTPDLIMCSLVRWLMTHGSNSTLNSFCRMDNGLLRNNTLLEMCGKTPLLSN